MHHNTKPWYHGLAMHDTEQAHQCNLERDMFWFVPWHYYVAMSMLCPLSLHSYPAKGDLAGRVLPVPEPSA